LLVLATLLATGGWVFSTMALRGLPPLLFIGVRFALAGGIVGAFGVGDVRTLAIRGVASASKAKGMATVGHAAIIMNLEPVWTAFVAAMWLGMGMRATQAFGSALDFLALILNRWNDISPLVVKGTRRLDGMIGARLCDAGGLTIGGCGAPYGRNGRLRMEPYPDDER
jgi:drug/metabolite transporter (DMT)-like permease